MQHSQQDVVAASQEDSVDTFKISVLNRAGPSLLLGAFAILLFKTVPSYWPLILTAFLGYGVIRIFAKGGFYLSLAALVSVGFFLIRASADGLWTSIFSLSIALSWFLIYWEGREAESLTRMAQQKFIALKEKGAGLEKELRRQKAFHAEQVKGSEAELQHLKKLHGEVCAVLQAERAASEEKRTQFSSQVLSWQNQERGWQQALEAMQNELMRLQTDAKRAPVVEESVVDAEEEVLPFDLIHHQYAALREQFDEKSEKLDAARKELFRLENEHMALQRMMEEKGRESGEEVWALHRDLKAAQEESLALEKDVLCLQEVISSLVLGAKHPAVRKRKAKKDVEESLSSLLEQHSMPQSSSQN